MRILSSSAGEVWADAVSSICSVGSVLCQSPWYHHWLKPGGLRRSLIRYYHVWRRYWPSRTVVFSRQPCTPREELFWWQLWVMFTSFLSCNYFLYELYIMFVVGLVFYFKRMSKIGENCCKQICCNLFSVLYCFLNIAGITSAQVWFLRDLYAAEARV